MGIGFLSYSLPLLHFLFCSLALSSAFASVELKYLSHLNWDSKTKIDNTKVGGLSGIVYLDKNQNLYAVSDDRGQFHEPRVYEFDFKISNQQMQIKPKKMIALSVNDSQFAHDKNKKSSRNFSAVIDMEAIALLPWGDFLLTNEGDLNHRPRVLPQIFSANLEGQIKREYEIPNDYLPEKKGQQTKGIRNNLGFEGLAAHPDGKRFLVATEGRRHQDSEGFVRFLMYEVSDAFVIKPTFEWKYPLAGTREKNNLIEFPRAVTEVVFLNSDEILILERSFGIGSQGFDFQIQIFSAKLVMPKKTSEVGLIEKKLLFDLDQIKLKLGGLSNFEGMSLGPTIGSGQRTLILVSDDNFKSELKTQFVLFEIKGK